MREQAIAIFCICDEVVKYFGIIPKVIQNLEFWL